MKKLLAIFCAVLYLHCIGQSPLEIKVSITSKSSGEKVLVKALTAIVNREGNKRAPIKRIQLPSSEDPWI